MSRNIDTILISHSNKDELYAKELVEMIKVNIFEKLSVRIICTSLPGHGIPGDGNIYDYLREKLQGNVWVIYLLSQNYYGSAASLNEMGATWVQNKKHSTFIVPNFSFREIKGAIDPSKKTFRLCSKSDLNDFSRMLCDEYNLDCPDSNIWESVRDKSLEDIDRLNKAELEKSRTERVEFETVEVKGKEEFQIAIRVINQNDYTMKFTFIKASLKDIDGNTFDLEEELVDIPVYSGENKIIFIPCTQTNSNYSASRHDKCNITNFRFLKIH